MLACGVLCIGVGLPLSLTMDECSAQPDPRPRKGLNRVSYEGKVIQVMKRFRFAGVGVAILAVLALSAMALASTASAVTFLLAEFLENTVGIGETILVETSGELTMENTKAPIVGNAGIKCSGILDGDIGPDGAEDITELLNLETPKALINATALTELALLCSNILNCESSRLWAVNLPWLTLLVLWEIGSENGFATLLMPHTGGGNVGWYVECTDLGIKASEECATAEAVAEAKNVTGGVEGTFSDPFTELMGLKLATCSGNKEETGIITGSGVTVTSLAGPLTVSE